MTTDARLLALVVAWTGTASLAVGCGGPSGPPAPATASKDAVPVVVRVARVETATAPVRVQASGSFQAADEVEIAAEVAGRVVETGPEIGDRVGPKAVLARLDRSGYVLVRAQREKVLREVLTRLGLERLPAEDEVVDFEKLPSVDRAVIEATNAQAKYERAVRLRERAAGSMSVEDVADRKLEWDVAEAALRAARLAARTDLQHARTRAAELAVAEKNLKDVEIVTPEAGGPWVVASRDIAVGDYVGVGSRVYRLLDVDPLRLVVRVPERKMVGIEKGKTATIDLARPGGAKGIVVRVRPEVDVRTRTHEVEIEVENAAGELSVGAFAVVHVEVREDTGVPVVPSSSVVSFAGVTKLLVPEGGKAADRRVTLGRTLGDLVEVVSGAKAGDPYVVSPPNDLVAGTPITVEAGGAVGASVK